MNDHGDLDGRSGGAMGSGRELRQFHSLSTTTSQGPVGIVVGLLFIGIGVSIGLVAAGVIPVDDGSIHVPRSVLAMVGGVFAAPGLIVLASGIASTVAGVAARRRMAARPDEPWEWDHPWDREGSRDRGGAILRTLTGAVVLSAFLVPFHFVLLTGRVMWLGLLIGGLVIGVFDLIALALWGSLVYVVLRRLKYGRAAIRWDRFPIHLGDEVTLTFEVPKALRTLDGATATLRCVKESAEHRGESQQIVCRALHEEERAIDGESLASGEVALTFTIPRHEVAQSHFTSSPRSYWDLEVKAEAPGIDYHGHFLIPVYA